MGSLPLFDAYPRLREALPHVKLAQFPTPVGKLTSLGERLQHDQLYIKRDDLCSDLYGSNKVRKLEFFLSKALQEGIRDVVTLGFAGSNHSLATAIYANSLGLRSTSFLLPQRNAHYVRRNLLASFFFKANLVHAPGFASLCYGICKKMLQRRLQTGKFPLFIAGGGSSTVGVPGYVNAAFELAEQIQNGEVPKPDYIYVPLGSTGTMLGLMLGFKALNMDIKVVGVRVIEKRLAPPAKMVSLFHATVKKIRMQAPDFPNLRISKKDLLINDDFMGKGYATFTEQGSEAAQMVEADTGIILNGAYTAKAFAALIHDIRSGKRKGKTVLYWNTYNSKDLSPYTANIDYRSLPAAFHHYFEEPVQQRDEHGRDR